MILADAPGSVMDSSSSAITSFLFSFSTMANFFMAVSKAPADSVPRLLPK